MPQIFCYLKKNRIEQHCRSFLKRYYNIGCSSASFHKTVLLKSLQPKWKTERACEMKINVYDDVQQQKIASNASHSSRID